MIRQVESIRVARLRQYLPDTMYRVLTVSAARSNVENGTTDLVSELEVLEQVLARLRMHVRRRDGRIEADPSNGRQKRGVMRKVPAWTLKSVALDSDMRMTTASAKLSGKTLVLVMLVTWGKTSQKADDGKDVLRRIIVCTPTGRDVVLAVDRLHRLDQCVNNAFVRYDGCRELTSAISGDLNW